MANTNLYHPLCPSHGNSHLRIRLERVKGSQGGWVCPKCRRRFDPHLHLLYKPLGDRNREMDLAIDTYLDLTKSP